MGNSFNVHEGHRARLCEKLIANADQLCDHELLEVLLFYAIPRKDTNALAHKLLKEFESIDKLFSANFEQLVNVDGVGEKTATMIVCLGKIMQRFKNVKAKKMSMYTLSDVKEMLIDRYMNLSVEKFTLSLLNKNYLVIKNIEFCDEQKSFVGVDAQEIAKEIAVHRPSYAVLSHNHVSGNVTPSEKDHVSTKKIRLLCELYGVELIDHVIISGTKTFSYFSEGLLDKIKKEADVVSVLKYIKEME